MNKNNIDLMGDWQRSCRCGEPGESDVGRELTLMGWTQSLRDHGGLLFIDLRDRTGIVQVVVNPEVTPEAHEKAKRIRSEDVLAVRGTLVRRSEETVNSSLGTGAVELMARELRVLNPSRVPPFPVDDEVEPTETSRFRYRYLDLRRPRSLRPLEIRHRMLTAVRAHLDGLSFMEVETPILTKSTPEGARDYLVPSRMHPGKFYALPQSPQLFKQVLMVGGVDRYFQVVRCFRDEDLRMDRQPEFTQLDIEMSFVRPEDIFEMVEGMMARVFREVRGVELETPFRRLRWEEAMSRYGSDKPDLRFGLELVELSDTFRDSEVGIFKRALAAGGIVKGLMVPGAARAVAQGAGRPDRAGGALRRQGAGLDQGAGERVAVAADEVPERRRAGGVDRPHRRRARRRDLHAGGRRRDRQRRPGEPAAGDGRPAGPGGGRAPMPSPG